MTDIKCDVCEGSAHVNVKKKDNRNVSGSFQHKASLSSCSVDGIATQQSSLRENTRVLTPNRHHHTCPVVEMELVCVGTVEGVGDLAINSHVWI